MRGLGQLMCLVLPVLVVVGSLVGFLARFVVLGWMLFVALTLAMPRAGLGLRILLGSGRGLGFDRAGCGRRRLRRLTGRTGGWRSLNRLRALHNPGLNRGLIAWPSKVGRSHAVINKPVLVALSS